jgi:uncharacterized iron-regulated protein
MRGMAILVAAISLLAGPAQARAGNEGDSCPRTGEWLQPADPTVLKSPELLRELAGQVVVLLGENHTNPEHHRWQLHTVAALHAINPRLVLGFEAFPRRVQPLLDRWVSGELQEQAFLEAVDWDRVWGYDADLYLPLFHFARHYRIPMVALNVERELVSRVADEGWEAVPVEDREGVSKPADAGDDYRRWLAAVYLEKRSRGHQQESNDPAQESNDPAPESLEPGLEALAEVLGEPGFQRFVQAQLTWDRAMAEALTGYDDRLVVGIIGRGHVAHGYGVAHQLRALGVDRVKTLLPVGAAAACEPLEAGLADALFVVPDWVAVEPERPLLGVMIEPHEHGVRVAGVSPGSVAASAGIEEGDVITRAAGLELDAPADLIGVVRRQAPGTWLPLRIDRDDQEIEIVARLPPAEQVAP